MSRTEVYENHRGKRSSAKTFLDDIPGLYSQCPAYHMDREYRLRDNDHIDIYLYNRYKSACVYVQWCSEVMRHNHLPHNQAIKAKTTTTPIMDDNFLWALLFCGEVGNEKEFLKESIKKRRRKNIKLNRFVEDYTLMHTSSSHYKTDIK